MNNDCVDLYALSFVKQPSIVEQMLCLKTKWGTNKGNKHQLKLAHKRFIETTLDMYEPP